MVADYYAMLAVEPSAAKAEIEAALARCQPIWSSGTRNPKNKHLYQSYLDSIPSLKQALLGEPWARAAYDAERAAAHRADRDRKLDELQRLLRLRAAKGGLTVSDRALLRDEATRLGLTHDDLDRLAESIPPKPEAPMERDDDDATPDVIEPALRRQIRVTLEHLGKRDLYDALSLARDAPASVIAASADAERRRWMQKTQVTAEKTAWLEAISYAQSHLASPEARARYDATLALEGEETLQDAIRFAIQGASALDAGTRRVLVGEAAVLGIAADRAEKLLRRVCRAGGVALEGGSVAATASTPPRWLRCRACAGVTEFGAAARSGDQPSCRHCSAPLRWSCPVCQRALWVDEPRCVCGFPLAHREPMIRHFEAAQQAFRLRDFTAAMEHLDRSRELAPQHVGTRKAIERVKERLAAITEARRACEVAIARRALTEARSALDTWARLVDPSSPELAAAKDEIVRGLRKAHSLAAHAEKLISSDAAKARGGFLESLAVATDLAEAKDGLRRCPPDAALNLAADLDDGRVRLRWSAPPPDGLGPLAFRVVRKRHAIPANSNDGVLVAEVEAAECDDPSAPAGDIVGYAVFAQRHGVSSRQAATIAPFQVLSEVANLRVDTQSHEVHLSWKTPKNAVDARVIRKQGAAPLGPDDGHAIDSLREHAIDRGLKDDQVYHYGVFARYKGADGRLVCSRGSFASTIPCPPELPIIEPILSLEAAGKVRIAWKPPERGQVKVVRSARPVPHTPGDRLTNAQISALDGIWLEANGADHTVDPNPPTSGICHYTPMTAWAGNLVLGKSALFSHLPDPSDLRAVRAGKHGRIHLRWRWCPQAVQSLVVAKAGEFPAGPDDAETQRAVVQDAEYSRQGFFAWNLPASPRGPWHLRVYTVAIVDGFRVVSTGIEPTAKTILPGPHPEVTVSYKLRPPRFPRRTWTISFWTDPPGSPIPPTALVAHHRTVPLSVEDGQIVDRFPAAHDGQSFPIQGSLRLRTERARIFPDPHADPEGMAPIRIQHPDVEGTRV